MSDGGPILPDTLLIESVIGGGLSAVMGSDDEEDEERTIQEANEWYSSIRDSQPRKQQRRRRGRRKKTDGHVSISGSNRFKRDPSDTLVSLKMLYDCVAPTTERIIEEEIRKREDPEFQKALQKKNEDDLCRLVDEIFLGEDFS
jgi:hypothetical protein